VLLDVLVDQLSAAGYAASRPVASNDTTEGRQANRRLDASQPVGEPTPTSVR